MENVCKRYKVFSEEVEVLKGINLTIERGEFVSIMGASGSGKTTLMNLIGCLDVPTSGRYVFADQDVTRLTDDQLSVIRNEHIGFVFQSFYLLPYANVLENVLLPSLYMDRKNDRSERRAHELLELVGLKDRIKFKPAQLSGGQQQRVAIARALINDPELLLADEPTGQLDSNTSQEIMDLIAEMHKRGKTVVLVTHEAATAAYAKRQIRMKDGMIVK
jgi:putative ABC transport system ATP-binding protein